MDFLDTTLLSRLRSGTRMAQGALEAAQSRMPVATVEGLSRLLAAERDILSTMAAAEPELAEALAPTRALLAADLAELGVAGPGAARTPPRTDDVLARGYVLHGCRLWLKMAARALPEAGPGQRYMRLARDMEGWRALCAELEAAPGIGARAERCVSAANDWFAICESICHDHARR